jgi:hypothetical protein
MGGPAKELHNKVSSSRALAHIYDYEEYAVKMFNNQAGQPTAHMENNNTKLTQDR